MRRTATLPRLFILLTAICFPAVVPPTALAHSPEDTYSARADLRIDEQRGLRVRTWFEVPESSKVAQGEADAAVAQLGECLELTLGEEPLAGSWVAGDDPKHGLSNGSHRLIALEFEPDAAPTGSSLDVTLVVNCFLDKDLTVSSTSRARSPWQVVEEEHQQAPSHHAHGHEAHDHHADGHKAAHAAGEDGTPRRVRVRFSHAE
jgi:hypothetical protein